MKRPTIVYWSWRRSCPQFIVLGALIAGAWALLPAPEKPLAFIIGPFVYLAYSVGSRYLIPFSHRRGMAALARKDYGAAISHFSASYEFFSRHSWLDRFRAITMMTPLNWSYREMALLNIATAYVQQGRIGEAKEYFERVNREFPQNEYAQSALQLFEAFPNPGE